MGPKLIKAIAILSICGFYIYAYECPKKCVCKSISQTSDWVKVRCGDVDKVESFEELDLLNLANEVLQLNLSNNHLTSFAPKVHLEKLQKLDLSNNQLTTLQANEFIELPNLRRLDISGNNIKTIEKLAFLNLKHLERLKLNRNQIGTIEKGTFKALTNLKQLDISSNPLTCDCELLWLLDWADKASIKLVSNPKCSSPPTFKGQPLRKIKIGVDIHCKSPAGSREIPILELIPDHSQVVFEGDSLKLHCRAPSIDIQDSQPIGDHITWSWLDTNPKHYFNDILIEKRYLAESGLIDSALLIENLNRNHTGTWGCTFISKQGNHSKGITIVVISDETEYCPITTTTNNKGSYMWPRAVVNHTVSVPCESIQLTTDISQQKATYFCSASGEWKNLNTSKCAYISDTTKILEQFSKVNLSLTKGTILESAKHFKNYTSDLKVLKDVMDLVFVVRTIENYVNYMTFEQDLSPILLDVSNHLLDLPEFFLLEADREDGSCQKLVASIERIAGFVTPSPTLHKSNMALEEFPVKPESFSGMTCIWYDSYKEKSERSFHCASSSQAALPKDKAFEAFVQIPKSLFYQLREQDFPLRHASYRLLVTMFNSNKLFPYESAKEGVTSPIVGVKLENMTVNNLTDPIYVVLHAPTSLSYEVTVPTPVWWNPILNGGKGGWSSEGCEYSHGYQDNLVFSCRQLGYYGLLQNVEHLSLIQAGAKFRFSHPAVYVGSFLLFSCLLISILTYLLCYTTIQMPKKTKHSLINTWIAISLLCFMYVFGIYQTENMQVCQAVGLMLHYFTLSSLLWMCVGVNSMYKRLRKNDAIELQDDELPSEEPIQKPILGLYLVGWGIALIVCGISGAVNMKEYSSHTHCFLNSGPALSALYIPFTILMVFLAIFFLLIRCSVYSTDTNGHLSEGTQATENVDLDLLEPNFPTAEVNSIRSVSSKTASSEMEDPEHAPLAQLKAYVIFLVIYVVSWFSCAFATVQPFPTLPLAEDIFSVIYAIFSSILGAFTLFFYCVARHDVRTQWSFTFRWWKRKGACFRSRNVSDAAQNIPQIQIQPLAVPPVGNQNVEVQITSRSSSRSSTRTKSNSHTSNILKAAADFNTAIVHEAPDTKINNVNLLTLHRQQYVLPNLIENPTNSAEMFYNPRQSTVARKFFKKQKRNMMKRNNIVARRNDYASENNSMLSCPKQMNDNSSMDQSIFGTNSKVNNTNIHVECVKRNKQRNPNIFSDSCEDINSIENIPVGNLVKHADRVRKREMYKGKTKKKENVPSNQSSIRESNMRSVSQQCTLEYSSETISDSILDKSSPDKCPIQDSFLAEISGAVPSARRENSPVEAGGALESPYHNANCVTLEAKEKYGHKVKRNVDNVDSKRDHYEPSDVSLSVVDSTSEFHERVPRIYVNPHDLFFNKRVQSRASSVSASELDEIYQQIRRGPKSKYSQSQRYVGYGGEVQASPYLSDSEITSFNGDIKYRRKQRKYSGSHASDNETTV